jgi:predicted RNA-binding Zn-ribbon protein involved in translation (DUF1610 family)
MYMPGPQCASCGYSIDGLAEPGRQLRCPECGYEQLLRLSPAEVRTAGAWFSSFFIGGAILVGCMGSLMLLSLLVPIDDRVFRAMVPLTILGSFTLGPLVASIRFTRRLTRARRLAGWPPEGHLVRFIIVATTFVFFAVLYVVIVLAAAFVFGVIRVAH